jgi:hypothetical protein
MNRIRYQYIGRSVATALVNIPFEYSSTLLIMRLIVADHARFGQMPS